MSHQASSSAIQPRNFQLSQKRIFRYWLPLAASWVLMGCEMPFISGALARLSEAERTIAAFGVVASLIFTIESPIVALLSTSTALARSRQNYHMLRRFTLHLMIGTTALHLLLGWSPLFDLVVVKAIGVPESLIEPIQLGLRIIFLWSAAIAWRRFKQGILIRYGRTGAVGRGTMARLLSSAGTATILAVYGQLPGIAVATLALTAGVLVEASYAHWAAHELITNEFSQQPERGSLDELSYRELVKFHWPLAASNLLFLLTQPLIGAALSRSPNPVTALAAWPLASGILFITRAPALALPEVTIALIDEPDSHKQLKRFSLWVGLACVAALAALSFTPLADFYFQTLLGVSAGLAGIAVTGGRLGLALPMIMAGLSLYRGILTASRTTLPVTLGMTVELTSLAAALAIGVLLGAPGVPLAAIAMTIGMGADMLMLLGALRRS